MGFAWKVSHLVHSSWVSRLPSEFPARLPSLRGRSRDAESSAASWYLEGGCPWPTVQDVSEASSTVSTKFFLGKLHESCRKELGRGDPGFGCGTSATTSLQGQSCCAHISGASVEAAPAPQERNW
ncbi:uncharacterized protein LOC143652216 isoform X2 [Tamandua tetradactyla]|uniref:uncharacterized protein LOC143652216 isoform X2 n=1 Tax=Tamandua tetradactyla TaxID=48850 RepID=UPI004053D446